MVRKGRKLRKFEWERIMRKQAWSAEELAEKLHIHPTCMRRYLRIFYEARRLERKRFGVMWFYAVSRFLSSPDLTYPCPHCRARMEVYYVRKCGCEFSLCSMDRKHDAYKYCSKHAIPVTAKTVDKVEVKVRE